MTRYLRKITESSLNIKIYFLNNDHMLQNEGSTLSAPLPPIFYERAEDSPEMFFKLSKLFFTVPLNKSRHFIKIF